MAATVSDEGPEVRVFEPHSRGLPPMRRYLRDVWAHRVFVYYVSRANLKSRHFDTWFGQLWHILNPLFLAAVYFLLVMVIRGSNIGLDYLLFIIGGLFAFYFTRNAIGSGASSVVSGAGFVTSTTMPRALLPISSVATALLMYLPTLLVYGVLHLAFQLPVGPQLVMVPVIVAIHTVFNVGLAMFFGVVTVYFRDTSSFLPYFLRIWLYISPVIYRFEDLPATIPTVVRQALVLNPLYPILTAWHQVLNDGVWPDAGYLLASVAWAAGSVVIGGWLFLSAEREFAVRI
jgi:teichoic acid transport system permease protein